MGNGYGDLIVALLITLFYDTSSTCEPSFSQYIDWSTTSWSTVSWSTKSIGQPVCKYVISSERS